MATKTTTVYHLVDKRFVGITPEGQRVMIDGETHAQTGMRPMELLLNALGACAAYDIVEMLKKRRLEVRSYHIELTGERPDATPAPYTRIHAKHVFDVPGLDEKTATRFVDLGMNKYCSVAASLNAAISFEVHLQAAEGVRATT
ncbi:OsmC family protein [Truepera radiovictrix]|uniref:OsmC family protein n=1 Tax=Truepera radiovictrix (strain DSM 17093 / CIP 108686 / LMG 22925 / RQ-24) TaxID=649638 RepID=D7CY16_TRURR|nr:OsmC family protein [Truepera radiovictrix]ADI13376.1 OsmC family protein [Truepera radiovictrix DSM 17093]WMT58061.1 OsmC family protein [Truepera radiovictrix]